MSVVIIYCAFKDKGLKYSLSAGPLSVSGNAEQVQEAIGKTADFFKGVVDDYQQDIKDQQRRTKETISRRAMFASGVYEYRDMRRNNPTKWAALSDQVKYSMLMGMSFEQRGLTQDQYENGINYIIALKRLLDL